MKNIKSGKIEIVLATRKLQELYHEQDEEIGTPFLTIRLAIGYESELDNCPIESEYHRCTPDSEKTIRSSRMVSRRFSKRH